MFTLVFDTLDSFENLIKTTDPEPRKTCGYKRLFYFRGFVSPPTPNSFMDPG